MKKESEKRMLSDSGNTGITTGNKLIGSRRQGKKLSIGSYIISQA